MSGFWAFALLLLGASLQTLGDPPAPPANNASQSALLVPLAPAPANLPTLASQKPSRFRVTVLPFAFEANAINNKGEIAGTLDAGYALVSGQWVHFTQAAVWKNNVLITFPNMEEQRLCYASAISETSDVGSVGGNTYSDPIHGRYDAFVWSLPSPSSPAATKPPTSQKMGHLRGLSGVFLTGINSRRQAVGWCYPWDIGESWESDNIKDAAGQEVSGTAGFYWDGQKMQDLGGASVACGINEQGQVVGEWHGFITLWQEKERRFLGEGKAFGINNRGWVVGERFGSGARRYAFLWRGKGSVQELKGLSGNSDTTSQAKGINDRGQVVGNSASETTRAFLWQAGKMYDLNGLLMSRSGWILREARSINNRGQIVGVGTFQGKERSFLLTPSR